VIDASVVADGRVERVATAVRKAVELANNVCGTVIDAGTERDGGADKAAVIELS